MRWDGRFTSADHCLDTNTGTAAAYKPLTSTPSWIRRAAQQENTAGSPNRWRFWSVDSCLHGHRLYNQETTKNPFCNLYVVFVFGLQDKKKVACRHDWHQTGKQVVVTIYAKNSSPEHSYVEANRTVVSSDQHTSIQWLFINTFVSLSVNTCFCVSTNLQLTCHIQFEGDKVFHKDIHLWGVRLLYIHSLLWLSMICPHET